MKTLDTTERQVLLKKYIANGLNFYEARDKLDKFHNHLKSLNHKLRKQGKSEKQIDIIFKQEFEKLCRKLGV